MDRTEGSLWFARINGGLILANGDVVVADGGRNRIFILSPAGEVRHEIGREGSGPGEFRDIQALWRGPGDSIYVHDWELGRVSALRGANFIRSFSLEGTERINPVGAFRSGLVIALVPHSFDHTTGEAGLVRPSVKVRFYRADGSLVRMVDSVPGAEVHVERDAERFAVSVPPFQRKPVIAVGGEHLAIGNTAESIVTIHDGSGTTWELEVPFEPVALTERLRERITEAHLETFSNRNTVRRMERLFAEMSWPEFLPRFGDMVFDAEERLWIGEEAPPDAESVCWMIHDFEEGWIASIRLPAGMRILDVSSSRMLVRVSDELGVPRVELYELIRG